MQSSINTAKCFWPVGDRNNGVPLYKKKLPTQPPLPHSPTHPPPWVLGITADGETGQWFVLKIIKGRKGKYVRTPIVLQ